MSDEVSIRYGYEFCECPDCGESIPLDVQEGDECVNCGHVFWSQKDNDD